MTILLLLRGGHTPWRGGGRRRGGWRAAVGWRGGTQAGRMMQAGSPPGAMQQLHSSRGGSSAECAASCAQQGEAGCTVLWATVDQTRAGQGTCKISYKALLVDWLHQCTVAARNKRGGAADEGCMQHAGRWWGATAPMRDRWTRGHISTTGCMFRDAGKQKGGGCPRPTEGRRRTQSSGNACV